MRRLTTALVLLGLAAATEPGCAQRSPGTRPSILEASGDTLHLQVLDAASRRPFANVPVTVSGDNGVRCTRAPCPTGATEWRGRSDAAGRVSVPRSAMQPVTSIATPDHDGDLVEDSEPAAGGAWVAALLPRDTGGLAPHPIRLVDRRTQRPIANMPVRIEYRGRDGRAGTLLTRSGPLGYVFVPFVLVAQAGDDVWAVVPGYRRAKLDFAYERRRTELARKRTFW